MTELWIIAPANEQDLSWVHRSKILQTKPGAYYCGEPCITVFPNDEQLTMLVLKFGERLIKVPITSREQAEILNPENFLWPI